MAASLAVVLNFIVERNEDAMGANHSGERRKRRMKRSRRNLVTREKAAQASSGRKRAKKKA